MKPIHSARNFLVCFIDAKHRLHVISEKLYGRRFFFFLVATFGALWYFPEPAASLNPAASSLFSRDRNHHSAMSSSRLSQGNDFTLPHRTVLDTHRSVYPSNRNRPDLKNQGPWTNKQYGEIDHVVRDTIEDIFEVVTGGTPHESGKQEPDNIPGEATSYTKLIKILHEAKEHHSKTVRCNLAAVASGLDTGSGWIDDGQYHTESCQDPELDVDGARDSKFCIMETIREEAEKLGTKEFESVMYCLEIVLGGMRELVRCWRLRNGWDDRMMQFGHPHQGHVPQHVNVPEHVEGGSR